MYKIVDESILFFSRVSLSKFSLEPLYISWVKGIYNRYEIEYEKSFFSKTRCIGKSLMTVMSREFQLRVTRLGQIVIFVM